MPENPHNDDAQDVIEATAEDVEISDPETPGKPSRSAKRPPWPIIVIIVLVVVIAAAVAITATMPELVQRALGTQAPASAQQIAALEQANKALEQANKKTASELASLRTRVVALAGRVETMGTPADLVSRVEAVEKKVDGLSSSTASAAPTSTSDTEARAQIAALTERLAALESARAAPPAEPQTPAVTADQQKIAEERLKALQEALSARDQQLSALRADNEKLVQSMGGLAERLAKLEQARGGSGVASGTAALVLAAGQLRQALAGPGPFAEELTALTALAGTDPVIKQAAGALEPRAGKGVPTRRMLAARFDGMARKVVQAAIATENPGWVDKALARLAGVVTIRPTGDNVEGDSPTAILARGEARLKAGDLDGAVKELGTLGGASAKAADAWLTDARARLDADRAAAALNRHVIGRMAGVAPKADKPASE